MSDGRRVPLRDAWTVAYRVLRILEPHILRAEIAGSIRRGRPTVGDVEIVAEPKTRTADLFGGTVPDVEPIRAALEEVGIWEKGGERYMKVRHVLGSALSLDLFLVTPPAEWGSILAIRTGPGELGQLCVTRMKSRGYRHENGHVIETKTGLHVPTPTEEDFFHLAGVAYLAPPLRDIQAHRLLMAR